MKEIVKTVWINEEEKIISFQQIPDYEELQFTSMKEYYSWMKATGEAGYRWK